MISAITNYFLNRKLYSQAEQSRETNVDVLHLTAKQYFVDHVGATLENWEYLQSLILDGTLGTDFVIKNRRLFSTSWLLSYNNRVLLKPYGRLLLRDCTESTRKRIFGSQLLTPDEKFNYIDLESNIDYAILRMKSGVTITYRSLEWQEVSYITFSHSNGIASVPVSSILAFEVYNDYVYLNGHKSNFSVPISDSERKSIKPLFRLLCRAAAVNMNKQAYRPRIQNTVSEKSAQHAGVSPWVAGALGVGLGALAVTALADE